MKRAFRLTRTKDFKRVKETGRAIRHPLVVLVYASSDFPQPRIAVVASKSVGKAVDRNLAKRRLKSCLSRIMCRIASNTDLIFYARKDIVNADFSQICSAVQELLTRSGLLKIDREDG